ncbi:MAG: DUF1615 family protein [Rhizobiales bacterium]|nr:DUF1615 family protein [Hyphomicrobiales bacterium]
MLAGRFLLSILCLVVTLLPVRAETMMAVQETASLIRRAEKGVDDAQGWAIDLLDVLQLHDLSRSRENVCAVIAVVDQESGFVADPAVPGLGKLSEQALRDKLARLPVAGKAALGWLERTPSPQTSFMSRIRAARTERDLDLVYRALIQHAGQKSGLGEVVQLGFLNRLIEDRNEIDTAGSMQVSVKFALDMAKRRRWLPMMLDDVYAVRDQLYTRHGGLYYGIPQLLDYETGYSRKLYRFADYNAGRYASRNAAFQKIVAELSGEALALDGDLLSYAGAGKANATVTASEKAIRKAVKRHALGLGDTDIRNDLLEEKKAKFVSTRTYTALRDAYARKTGRQPAFAMVPEIGLASPKIQRRMTTRIFAESVDRRYQSCMK